MFSTHAAWKKATGIEEDDPNLDLTLDKTFIEIFEDKLTGKLGFLTNNIFEKYDVSDPHQPLIFALDCSHKDNWRMPLFPAYKLRRRMDKDKPFDIRKAFSYIITNVLDMPEIYESFNIIKIKSKHAEGDDVIATLVEKFAADKNVIIASDYDLLQLKSENTYIVNLFGEELTFDKLCESDKIQNVEQFLMFKILYGDTSDSIPHVFTGIGKKRCLQYVLDKKLLLESMIKDEDAKMRFIRNSKLIDLRNIPHSIKAEILEEYNNVAINKHNKKDIMFF